MHGPVTSILFADADEERRSRLSAELVADGYRVVSATTDGEARVKARNEGPQALLLGAGDTPTSALVLLDAVRHGDARITGVAPDAAAIVLAPPGELSLLRAFDRGADDVVDAQVAYLELRARLRALLRRLQGDLRGNQAVYGSLVIDRVAKTAAYADRELDLSDTEFRLLERLMVEPARVFTKRELLADVWGMPEGVRTRCLDAFACRLRRKLTAAGGGQLVINRRGVGYALAERAITGPRAIGQGEVLSDAA